MPALPCTRLVLRLAVVCLLLLTVSFTSSHAAEPGSTSGETFTLWQLPSRTPSQNMSYVLRSTQGQLVVVDGGNTGDADYLQGFLAAQGNEVEAWFVSHPHPDHVDALTALLLRSDCPSIRHIYASMPEDAWISQHEPQPPRHLESVQEFRQAVQQTGQSIEELALDQVITIDEMTIDVLGIKNPEITPNAINNSSIVIRVADAQKSVLFTGDLGVQGGHKLLRSAQAARLTADYVQMAHHGQAGVDINFYRAVRPRFCLWPTPAWLWDNNSGKGKGSGPWQTLSVREWMERMNVEKNFVSADGLIRID